MESRILYLPGSLRYQPLQLKEDFGYDNQYRGLARVEVAALQTLGELGFIPAEEMAQLTPEIIEQLLNIPTTRVDEIERTITKHDVRAWVREGQRIINGTLARWLHVPLTSYDPLGTSQSLQFIRAYQNALRPALVEFVKQFAELIRKFSGTLQIGRTHGQHALPITVGFWLATILNRILYNWEQADRYNNGLFGKISGAVGAYNAQLCLGLEECARSITGKSFEELVLEKVGLKPAAISTQILPPEPLAYFLYSCVMLSASLAQFGRDCRHLMRTEIGEIREAFEEGQVGSSTMAQKRNPINFENSEGMWIKNKNEFGKVLDILISEHQRDLTGSSVARDFPLIVINLQQQLNTYLRKNAQGISFLQRISIDQGACRKNFDMSSHLILAEPIYIALQMAGYQGDAHELVNRKLVRVAEKTKQQLVAVLSGIAARDGSLQKVVQQIPNEVWESFWHPESYTGLAEKKALQIVETAEKILYGRRIFDCKEDL